ncbi:MAG: carbohydrate kinase family protein [Acidobacteriota bacterium]|nr:carbohydrate kinase family protein [Acidobacteriota bacterium]
MTSSDRPRIFGTGLVALDLVLGPDPQSSVRSWAGGTCGNVLAILAFLGWEAFPVARMNGDQASQRVRADFGHWGMFLDFASCEPTANTPIVIQEIGRGRNGKPRHRFSWSCPKCGKWLPTYKPVWKTATETVAHSMMNVSVFFFDRLSHAALSLAKIAAERGAVVVFEPSGRGTKNLMAEAIRLAHIVKYSDQRMAGVNGVMGNDSSTLLEVQTLGENGLRYRHRFGRLPSKWLYLNAIPVPRLADSCGAGDWVTAGFLAKSTARGMVQLRRGGAKRIREALRYGQALASWNCGFEGARGGMYAVNRDAFDSQVAALIAGQLDTDSNPDKELQPNSIVSCPACPTTGAKLGHI